MTGWGLSTRAIAPVVGVSQRTVANDAQVSNVAHLDQTPEPEAEGEADAGSVMTNPSIARALPPPRLSRVSASASRRSLSTLRCSELNTSPQLPRPPVIPMTPEETRAAREAIRDGVDEVGDPWPIDKPLVIPGEADDYDPDDDRNYMVARPPWD